MLSKSLTLLAAILALSVGNFEANAQSGSRNAAPVVSTPMQYAPAASPSMTVQMPAQSVVTQTPAAQPFTSGCTNCQMGSATSTPAVSAAPVYAAPMPSYTTYASPVTTCSTPAVSNWSAPVYSGGSCSSQIYSRPAPVYRTIRSYAPVRVYRSSCGRY